MLGYLRPLIDRSAGLAMRLRDRLRLGGTLAAMVLAGGVLPAQASMYLPGQFDIDDTGGASYSIPIAVPPGTAGMVPQLSLNYHSRNGNGTLGMGWQLNGLSQISRCGKSIDLDGQQGSVNFDANDRFCLDGQRLIAINGVNGADGTEYRTASETFSKIISSGQTGSGPAAFTVWLKNGQVLEYGWTTDGKIEAVGRTEIRVWALNKIRDRSGNYLAMIYGKDTGTNGTGEFWPTDIIYTGNASILQPYNSVQFTYDTSRTDQITGYQGGVAVKLTRRLTNIKTYALKYDQSGTELVSDYRLSYSMSPTTGRSRLDSVTLCGRQNSADLCLPPTTFSWEDGGKQLVKISQRANDSDLEDKSPASSLGTRFFPGDVDGDGKADLIANDGGTNIKVYRSDGTGFVHDSGNNVTANLPCRITPDRSGKVFDAPCLLGDWSGDGKTDMARALLNSTGTTYAYTSDDSKPVLTTAYDGTTQPANEDRRYFALDLNDDGKTDIIYRDVNGLLQKFISGGGGYFTYYGPTQYCDEFSQCSWTTDNTGVASDDTSYTVCDDGCVTINPLPAGSEILPWHDDRFWTMDVDGDGRVDLVVRRSNGNLTVLRSWPYGTPAFAPVGTTATIGTDSLPVNHQRYFPMDVNGDGRMDMVIRGTDGTLHIYLSNGTGWDTALTVATEFTDSVVAGDKRWAIMDVNGDGLSDLVIPASGNRIQVFLSNGRTFTAAGWLTDASQNQLAFGGGGSAEDQTGKSWFVMDVNGDGRADLVHRANNGDLRVFLSNGTNLVYDTIYGGGLANAQWSTTGDRYFLMDMTGDGRLDLVMRDSYGALHTWSPSGTLPDRIKQITGSLGNRIQVDYRHLTDTTNHPTTLKPFYERGTETATYPQVVVRNAMSVVSEVRVDSGLAGDSWQRTTYRYTGARMNAHSAAFLGFRTMTSRNEQTALEETKTYNFDYGAAPEKVEVRYAPGSDTNAWVLGSRMTYSYGISNLGGGRSYVYPTSTVKEVFEMTGSLTGQQFAYESTTWNNYDAYGNATTVTAVLQARDGATVADQLTTTTTQTWSNDTANWLIGKQLTATVTKTQGSTSLTRKSSFAYNSIGLLTQEVIEPDQPAYRVQKDYTYTVHGNRDQAILRGATTADDRTTTYTYDAKARFLVKTQDPLGYIESVPAEYDARFGSPSKVTDVNGLQVVSVYDGLGRKISDTAKPTSGYSSTPADLVTSQAFNFCNGVTGATGSTVSCPTTVPNIVYRIAVTATGKPEVWSYRDKLDREVLVEVQQAFDPAKKIVARRVEYNISGQEIKAYRPYFSDADPGTLKYGSRTYDQWGRTLTETAADGGVTTHEYNGRSYTVKNALNQPRTVLRGVENRVLRATDAIGGYTLFAYDPLGHVTQTTDAKGVVTTQTFDIRGSRTQVQDPNSGTWTYAYDLFGQLTTQTDAKAQTTTFTYDKLGRVKTKVDAANIKTEWTYDSATRPGGYWLRMLSSVQMTNLNIVPTPSPYLSRSVAYDAFGRIINSNEVLDGNNYTYTHSYDSAGRLDTLTYPGGFGVRQVYTAYGYLQQVQHKDVPSTVYWTANTVNAEGQVTQFVQGNGTTTTRTYDAATARLNHITAVRGGQAVQEAAVSWNAIGNVTSRTDWLALRYESFQYDALSRLTQINLNGEGGAALPVKTFTYDSVGNFLTKSNGLLGLDGSSQPAQLSATYEYVAGTHRLTRVKNASGTEIVVYAHDNNGHVTSTAGGPASMPEQNMYRTISWTAENQPKRITRGGTWEEFDYGPGGQRWKQWESNGTNNSWTYYSTDPVTGALFESWIPSYSSDWRHRRYIRAGGELIAISVGGPNITTAEEVQYMHTDHLGSIVAVTNQATVGSTGWLKRYSFDPWGKRRVGEGSSGWLDDPGETAAGAAATERGFTGHEHLATGLTHMNGRVYDPLVGRFMSPDPFIQDATDTQAFNRYSYVGNNPLAFTDPSGYLKIGKLFKKLGKIASKLPAVQMTKAIGKLLLKVPILRTAAMIAISFLPGGAYIAAALNTYLTALAGGSMGDILRTAIVSFASAAAFEYINTGPAMQSLGHARLAVSAAVGCASALGSGGGARGCAGSVLSAGVGALPASGQFGLDLVVRSVAGGAIAKLTGGKFEFGAITAAMSYAASRIAGGGFNQSSSSGASANSVQNDDGYWDRNTPGGTGGFWGPPGGNFPAQAAGRVQVAWVFAVGLGGTVGLGPIAVVGGGGFMIDGDMNVSTFSFVGGGVTSGGAGGGAMIQFSPDAKSNVDLSGAASVTSIHAGSGIGGSVDSFESTTRDGRNIHGWGFVVGAQSNPSVLVGRTSTKVCNLEGNKCEGSLLDFP